MPSLSQLLKLGAGVGGGASAGAAAQSSGLSDLLAPLDYPRQALWNLIRSGKRAVAGEGDWGDVASAVPGVLGSALAGGAIASGAGAPLGLLLGSLLGGAAQGAGKATGNEAFNAAAPEDIVEALGGDKESLGGKAASLGLGIATDPLTYAGGLGGAKLAERGMDSARLSRRLKELAEEALPRKGRK